jgi:SAM-dependent methyltransferase
MTNQTQLRTGKPMAPMIAGLSYSAQHLPPSQSLPHHLQLIQMASLLVPRVLYAAAKLGLADRLGAGPKSAVELAGPMRLHAPSLHRLMRTLASLGILTEREEQRFDLTPLGAALKTGASNSARSTLLTFGSPWMQRAWDQFMHSLETGRTGMEKAWGMPFFDYLAQHAEDASLFSETMVGFHSSEAPAVANAYDFSVFKSVVDIGGGTGNLLGTVIARHAGPRGVLFDRPHVVRDAPAILKTHGVEERITIEIGNFFQTVPAGSDAYLLSHIIHDWNEEQSLIILGHCRKAMKPDGRLLIVENVLPAGDAPHPGKLLDIAMLVLLGGQERTETEYAMLLDRADFRLARVVSTESAVSVLEAVPA